MLGFAAKEDSASTREGARVRWPVCTTSSDVVDGDHVIAIVA
jgi:hypothetical protein